MANSNKRDVYGRVVHKLCLETNTHDYRVTMSHNYRVCQRSGCQAGQRLRDGQWVDVLPNTSQAPQPLQAVEPAHTFYDEATPLMITLKSVPPSAVTDSVRQWWLQ
jgi:hypothetical protein